MVTEGNNETMPSKPDYILGKFTKESESRISQTNVLCDLNQNNTSSCLDTMRICVHSEVEHSATNRSCDKLVPIESSIVDVGLSISMAAPVD